MTRSFRNAAKYWPGRELAILKGPIRPALVHDGKFFSNHEIFMDI
jgi:hypothetical protein